MDDKDKIIKMYSLSDVCEILNCSYRTLQNYIKDKRINVVRVGRNVKVTNDELMYIVQNGLRNKNNPEKKKVTHTKEELERIVNELQLSYSDLFVSIKNFQLWLENQVDVFSSDIIQFNDYNEGVKHCLGCVASAFNTSMGTNIKEINSVENNIENFKIITNNENKDKS